MPYAHCTQSVRSTFHIERLSGEYSILERLLPSPPAFHIAAGLIEDTSKAAAWDSAWDWARLKGGFSMPTMVGTATADTPATARNAFFAKLSLIPVRFDIISSILFLRFAPVTPDTQGSRDSTESRHIVRMPSA